jgi:hypothetical protein
MDNISTTLATGYLHFESSSGTTKQWSDFYNLFKREFNKELKKLGATNIVYHKGHFCLTGFFTSESGQIYYFSLSDVRSSNTQVMYRTADHYKDWRGGSNQWVHIHTDMHEQMMIK